jgi:predicted nucleic acid-binding protein
MAVLVIRLHFLDASALVKLVVNELGSSKLRSYFHRDATSFTTNTVCVVEALGVLKRKHLSKNKPDYLDDEAYFAACEELMAFFRGENIAIDDVGLTDRAIFDEVERVARGYSLDLSDAYQLVTLRRGFAARIGASGDTILISADEGLVKAARVKYRADWIKLMATGGVGDVLSDYRFQELSEAQMA